MAQTESSAPSAADAQAATAPSAEAAKPTSVVSEDDIKNALVEIRNSWHNYDKCEHASVCSAYFATFGVGLTFADGTLASFAFQQRGKASSHDCIVNARAALEKGDRALAVQWVMAARMTDPLTRNWLGDHPDAVVEAIKRWRG